jgi:hypothetical protein
MTAMGWLLAIVVVLIVVAAILVAAAGRSGFTWPWSKSKKAKAKGGRSKMGNARAAGTRLDAAGVASHFRGLACGDGHHGNGCGTSSFTMDALTEGCQDPFDVSAQIAAGAGVATRDMAAALVAEPPAVATCNAAALESEFKGPLYAARFFGQQGMPQLTIDETEASMLQFQDHAGPEAASELLKARFRVGPEMYVNA